MRPSLSTIFKIETHLVTYTSSAFLPCFFPQHFSPSSTLFNLLLLFFFHIPCSNSPPSCELYMYEQVFFCFVHWCVPGILHVFEYVKSFWRDEQWSSDSGTGSHPFNKNIKLTSFQKEVNYLPIEVKFYTEHPVWLCSFYFMKNMISNFQGSIVSPVCQLYKKLSMLFKITYIVLLSTDWRVYIPVC